MTRTEKEIFDMLKEVALEDGIMKIDETKLISNAMRTAISFDWYLEEALKDGIIDDQEQQKLSELRSRIYQEAKEIAEKDDVITKDEAKLLAKLSEKLDQLGDFKSEI